MLLVLFSCINAMSQVTVTSTTGTSPTANYTTLASAITAINDGTTHTGTVLCQVIAGYTETAPVGGFAITATGSVGNTITFVKSGAGANPQFTASAALTAGSLTDAIFKIIGGDFITIDGFTMLENAANVTTAAATNNMTEFGVALFYATVTDGCQNVTIKNCTIDLTRIYQNSFGIYANSTHSATVATTSATATGTTGGNSNLTITGNTITDVNQGISVVGPTAAVDHNDALVIGGSGLGNSITNFGSNGTFSGFANVSGTVNGILVRNVKNFTISNNTVTSSAGLTTAGTLRGIYINAFNNTPIGTFTNAINSNILDIKSGVLAGAISGIVSESTSATPTSTITINNNTINGLSHTIASATGTLLFIQQTSPYGTVSVSNNTFNSLTANTLGSATFISASYSMPTATSTQTYSNNILTGGFNKTGAGGTVTCYTSGSSSVIGSTHTSTGNNFSGITVTGATGITGWASSDGSITNTPLKNVTGNTFSNWIGGTSALVGITFNYGSNGSSINNNTINNLNSAGSITGIILGSSNSGASQTITGNTVTNLTSTGTGIGFNIGGIAIAGHLVTNLNVNNNIVNTFNNASSTGQVIGINAGAGATGTSNVYNNEVFGLNASGVTPLIGGIAVLGTTGSFNVYSNKVRNLNASGSTTNNGAASGFVLQGGINVNCYNNIVSNLNNALGSGINALMGFQVQSSNANSTYKIYNNSIFMNATSSGTNFGTSGIFHSGNTTATTGALDLVNNIIINQSVANGTGITAAFRRSIATLENYLPSSNRNLLYAGTPSATSVIFNDGTTSFQTISAFKTQVAGRETLSFTREGSFVFETPGSYFISLTPSSPDFLKPVNGILTIAESGAASFSSLFTTDYSSAIRAGNAGYAGTGTAPDLGAFEFNGQSPAPTIVLNSVTPAAIQQCTTSSRLVSATVTTTSGTITSVVLNYAFNGVAQTGITMTNTSGNIWEGSIPASVPTNATVTWLVSATNSTPLTSIYNGTTYKDNPLFGTSSTATASVATTCAGGSSTISAALSSPVAASYIAPTPASSPTTDEDLANVTITNGATTILNNSSARNSLTGTIGTATGTAGGYSDFTAFGPYGLSAGTTYNFSLSSIQDVTAYGNSMALYIDYNRNGVFTDAGENVYVATATTPGTHTETGSFTVPAGAFNGLTRMRVIVNEGLITSPTQPVSWGEFEEYSVNISGGTSGGGSAPAITSINWSNGATSVGTTNNLVVNPTVTTTYTATITAAGCPLTPSPTVTVTVNPLPTAPVATNSVQCGAQVPTASVSDPNSYSGPIYKWYADNVTTTALQTGVSNTYLTSIAATTTFYVSVTNPATTCESTRTAVIVTVTSPQAISLSTAAMVSSCLGNGTMVTASSSNTSYSYSWTASPVSGSGISGTVTGASQTFTPTALGTYVYSLSGTDGICTATSSVTITINPIPSSITLNGPITNCINDISSLTAVTTSIVGTFGTDSTTNTTTGYPAPFSNYYGGTKHQMLLRASELTAQGYTSGTPMSKIAFTVTGVGTTFTGNLNNFQVDMGHTSATVLNSTTFIAGLTNVLPAATKAIPTSGFPATVEFTFSSPFVWNGVDNVVIQTSYSNANSGTSTDYVLMRNSDPGFVSTNWVRTDSATASAILASTTPTSSGNARPNIVITGTQSNSITWSPTTNLFTDAAATIPYTGTVVATVYYQSATAATANYTATATSAAGCPNSATTTVSTSDCGIGYANLQFPGSATITTCATQTFYAQVYKAGVTEAAGQGAGITAWIGKNATNTNPATWAESSWQIATFNVQDVNNDEYQATFGPLAAGTYYIASRFVYTPGTYVYGGYSSTGGNFWDGTSNVNATLTVNSVSAPTATSPQTFCNSATVANLVATGTNLQWYVASTGGTALASTTALATGNYYVSQTISGCESTRTMVAVTVNVTTAPTATSPQTFCNSATVANLVATGTNLQWYVASTGGTALASTTALATGNYYVSQTISGCEGTRTMVAVTVNITTAPTAASPQTFCNSATVANLVATGTNLQWYAASTGGTALASTTALATGNYYVSQTISGCESTRTTVAVIVNVTNAPTAASPQTFCNSATVANLVATGTNLQWYAASTGGTALASTTALATGNYYVSQTISGCESIRTMVAVTVNVTAQPTASSPQTFTAPATIANIVITGTAIVWYPTMADAVAGTNPLPTSTPLVNNTTYYATQTVAGCTSAPLGVLVTVTLRNNSFDKDSLTYYPNPVIDVLNISYSNTISSIEVYNLLGQVVKFIQPNATSTQLDMSNLPTATYLVKVTSEGKTADIKIVKK